MTTRPEPSVIYRNTGDPDDAWVEATGNTFLAPSLDFETCCVCGPCASAITRTLYEPTLGRLQAMFETADVGGLWNFADTSGLYQDSAAAVAPAVGSPVGAMMDVSRRLEISDDDMALATVQSSVAVTQDGNTFSSASTEYDKTIGLKSVEVGKTYKIQVSWERTSASGVFAVYQRSADNASNYTALLASEAAGAKTFYVKSLITPTTGVVSNTQSIYAYAQVEWTGSITLSVKELKGYHATQATTANKPTLRQTPTTGRYWLEAIDAARALNVTFASAPGTMYTGRVTPEGVVWATETWGTTTKNLIALGAYNAGIIARDRAFGDSEKAMVERYFSHQLPADGEVV